MKLLISNCRVLDAASPRGFSTGMDILIDGDKIASVVPHSEIAEGDGADVIDGGDLLAVPGLVNAHTHSPEMLGKASHDRLPLEPWLVYMTNSMGRYSARDHYLASTLCAVETLKNGGTALLDHLTMPGGFSPEIMDEAMRAYEDVGIRATVAPLMPDPTDEIYKCALARRFDFRLMDGGPEDPLPSIAEQMAMYRAFHAKWNGAGGGRLRAAIGPGGVQWSSPEYLHASFDLARELDAGVHTHLMETRVQHETVLAQRGMTAVEFLSREGFLEPRLSLAHSVWLSDRDVRTIAESGAVPVHNPAANMRLGSGFSPIKKFIDAGGLPALGADGCMSGDHQNMFAIVHLAAMIHNSFDDGFDPARWISSHEAFSMATIGGARALRMESSLGAVEAGRLADIALLDLNSPALCPLNDAFHAMAYTVPSSSVRYVVVNGNIVVRGGVVTTIDEKSLYAECREAAARHAFDGDLPANVAEEIARVLDDRNRLYATTGFCR